MTNRILVIGLAVCLLSGCSHRQIAPEEASKFGNGKIKFSVSSMATYRYYGNQRLPKIFVVTLDGERGFYTYCSVDMKDECGDNSPDSLLAYCRERSNKSCKVFAVNGNIVWKNPGAWKTKDKVGMHYFVDHKGIKSREL